MGKPNLVATHSLVHVLHRVAIRAIGNMLTGKVRDDRVPINRCPVKRNGTALPITDDRLCLDVVHTVQFSTGVSSIVIRLMIIGTVNDISALAQSRYGSWHASDHNHSLFHRDFACLRSRLRPLHRNEQPSSTSIVTRFIGCCLGLIRPTLAPSGFSESCETRASIIQLQSFKVLTCLQQPSTIDDELSSRDILILSNHQHRSLIHSGIKTCTYRDQAQDTLRVIHRIAWSTERYTPCRLELFELGVRPHIIFRIDDSHPLSSSRQYGNRQG